jgi:hypothetical protein
VGVKRGDTYMESISKLNLKSSFSVRIRKGDNLVFVEIGNHLLVGVWLDDD